MIRVPGEYFDRFFDEIVGSQVAAEQFRTELAQYVMPDAEADGAYVSLRAGASLIVHDTVADCRPPHESVKERLAWAKLESNANFGVKSTVAAIKAVGDIYQETAAVPQHEAAVTQNLERVLRHLYGIAFSGKFVGVMNMEALRSGLNPRRVADLPSLFARYMVNVQQKLNFRDGLAATVDPDSGQVDIRPHHPRMRKIANRQCPATYVRVKAEGDGSQRALWKFMQTIGSVAVTEIYPQKFPIIPTAP